MKSLPLPVLDIDPFSEEFLTDPFKNFGSLRDSGPVFCLDAIGAYGVARHDEAGRLVRSFLSAGVDTTVNGISNLMYAFTVFPDEWAKVEPNQQSTRRAFNEGLRWRSTVQTFFRTSSRETSMGKLLSQRDQKS